MYEYLDRPPQIGDIVEFINNSDYEHNKLGSLHQVTEIREDGKLSELIPRLSGLVLARPNRFKVVKTKPGNTAQAGDTIIRIANGDRPIGTTHPVYRNFGEGPSPNRVYYADSCSITHTDVFSITHTDVLVLCKVTKQTGNPFKVGDRVRCISNSNSTRKIGDEFTVVKIHNDDVYYKDGFAAYYKYFELVQPLCQPSIQRTVESSIKVDSHWERSYTSGAGIAGEIIKIDLVEDNKVYWHDYNKGLKLKEFFNTFTPRQDLDNQPLGESTQVESTNQTTKEKSMDKTTLKLLLTLMGVKPEETKDATNSNYIGVITEGDNYIGYIYADSVSTIETIAAKPENEGRTIHTFKYTDSYTQAPRPIVKVTRASKTKA